ncbi:MAG: hypothetical protein R2751_13545 [Bacteroidales bacterium]
MLTALIPPPDRLISMSSALHYQGTLSFSALEDRRLGYADSKAFLTPFRPAGPEMAPVRSNAVDPGWVPTKWGCRAPDDLQMGVETQVWLASDQQIQRTGGYYHHRKEQTHFRGRTTNFRTAFWTSANGSRVLPSRIRPDCPSLTIRRPDPTVRRISF